MGGFNLADQPDWSTAAYTWYIALSFVDHHACARGCHADANCATFDLGSHRPAPFGCMQPKRGDSDGCARRATRSGPDDCADGRRGCQTNDRGPSQRANDRPGRSADSSI